MAVVIEQKGLVRKQGCCREWYWGKPEDGCLVNERVLVESFEIPTRVKSLDIAVYTNPGWQRAPFAVLRDVDGGVMVVDRRTSTVHALTWTVQQFLQTFVGQTIYVGVKY